MSASKVFRLSSQARRDIIDHLAVAGQFNLDVQQHKKGNRVVGLTMAWWAKSIDEKKTAYAELNRSRVGRSARLNGTVEDLAEY